MARNTEKMENLEMSTVGRGICKTNIITYSGFYQNLVNFAFLKSSIFHHSNRSA